MVDRFQWKPRPRFNPGMDDLPRLGTVPSLPGQIGRERFLFQLGSGGWVGQQLFEIGGEENGDLGYLFHCAKVSQS